MDKLWAPWRLKYVTAERTKGCVFCGAYKEKSDTKFFVITRSEKCFALLNIFPYNNGHILITPNRHIKDLERLTDKELTDLNKTTVKIISALKIKLKPHGFNIGVNLGSAAGAGIKGHLHIHVVPRWDGDTNFMPVIGKAKIISQSLDELYKTLTKCLQKMK